MMEQADTNQWWSIHDLCDRQPGCAVRAPRGILLSLHRLGLRTRNLEAAMSHPCSSRLPSFTGRPLQLTGHVLNKKCKTIDSGCKLAGVWTLWNIIALGWCGDLFHELFCHDGTKKEQLPTLPLKGTYSRVLPVWCNSLNGMHMIGEFTETRWRSLQVSHRSPTAIWLVDWLVYSVYLTGVRGIFSRSQF
jgi:hypothetical protein